VTEVLTAKVVSGLVTVNACDVVTDEDILSESGKVFVTTHQQRAEEDLCIDQRFFIYQVFFSTFFSFKKTLSNAKYEYAKIQREILSEDASAMIFNDFGLLHSPYCKISYLLTLRYVLKFHNLHMTQCAKIIVGFVANAGNVFIERV